MKQNKVTIFKEDCSKTPSLGIEQILYWNTAYFKLVSISSAMKHESNKIQNLQHINLEKLKEENPSNKFDCRDWNDWHISVCREYYYVSLQYMFPLPRSHCNSLDMNISTYDNSKEKKSQYLICSIPTNQGLNQ